MPKTICWSLILCFLTGIFFMVPAQSEDLKARMLERLPQITDLKARGIVGENNKGFLDFIGGKSEKKEVVDAENADRQKIYQAIGAKENTGPDLVGKRRALQIRENAGPGEWLQEDSGKWVKK
jgi:uncharacterized protein YdbL (DUF1318 family)